MILVNKIEIKILILKWFIIEIKEIKEIKYKMYKTLTNKYY